MTKKDKVKKRLLDLFLSILGLFLLWWFIFLLALISYILSRKSGFFSQNRVGQNGDLFKIFKIRTLNQNSSSIFKSYGTFLRRKKLDELPQLLNILYGNMSFVGPRPDIIGFADKLQGEDRIILKIKPGVTGPATLKYKDEEAILALQDDPENYNRTIIWVDKVEINKKYVKNWSFYLDLKYIVQSIF